METTIVFIPKENKPVTMKESSPFFLCNVLNELITKVFVNRFQSFMPSLVGPMQSRFVPIVGTQENPIMA